MHIPISISFEQRNFFFSISYITVLNSLYKTISVMSYHSTESTFMPYFLRWLLSLCLYLTTSLALLCRVGIICCKNYKKRILVSCRREKKWWKKELNKITSVLQYLLNLKFWKFITFKNHALLLETKHLMLI